MSPVGIKATEMRGDPFLGADDAYGLEIFGTHTVSSPTGEVVPYLRKSGSDLPPIDQALVQEGVEGCWESFPPLFQNMIPLSEGVSAQNSLSAPQACVAQPCISAHSPPQNACLSAGSEQLHEDLIANIQKEYAYPKYHDERRHQEDLMKKFQEVLGANDAEEANKFLNENFKPCQKVSAEDWNFICDYEDFILPNTTLDKEKIQPLINWVEALIVSDNVERQNPKNELLINGTELSLLPLVLLESTSLHS